MTIAEAAAILGLAPGTLRNQVYTGALRATKHGRDLWITPAELERYRTEHLGRSGKRGPDKAPRKRRSA